jgi:hypothetical protein
LTQADRSNWLSLDCQFAVVQSGLPDCLCTCSMPKRGKIYQMTTKFTTWP